MRPLRIGVCCYPTFGGSGVVATELGLALAARGHRIHFVTTGVPRRLNHCPSNVTLHEVAVRDYPMFSRPPYSLALASKLVEIAQWKKLDVIHVHYAIPHSASAIIAKDILGAEAPPIITTLHGTDITTLTDDPDYRPIIRWSIERSDAVTTPSLWLQREVATRLDISKSIDVIPNFIDTAHYTPVGKDHDAVRALFVSNGYRPLKDHTSVLIHVSNFRPVKRIDRVVDVFARVCQQRDARLILVGDGPQRSQAEARVRQLGIENYVRFLGKVRDFIDILRSSDLFVLPSASESFGLAALEAQACGVPVVATDVGGVSEVVTHGETGLLTPVDDAGAMTRAINELLDDAPRRSTMKRAARDRALRHFQPAPTIDRYERLYWRLLER